LIKPSAELPNGKRNITVFKILADLTIVTPTAPLAGADDRHRGIFKIRINILLRLRYRTSRQRKPEKQFY
jgi:hypothetical protein